MFNFISKSPEDTLMFAKNYAKELNNTDIIVLTGDLGSGKTKFTEGILSYYGIENEISSPTFTIVNEYNSKELNIYHFDVYRLNSSNDFYNIGGDEYFNKGLCIIEWGEIIEDALPPHHIKISFERLPENENYRKIIIENL